MPTTILELDQLESREVPSAAKPTLDLTHIGAEGTINGAIFSQYNARANPQNGPVDSFLRLNDGGREKGYNTDARPLQFDESRRGTSSIRVDELPLITVGGVQYRQIVLDVNEPTGRNSKISLDELQIFVSNNPSLRGYNEGRNTLGGLRPVWEMGQNRWVSLDASLNNQIGTGDMLVAIPDSLLRGGAYLALFSKFGVHQKANGAFEQWGPGFATAAPTTASISGIVFIDNNGNGQPDAGEEADGYEVVLTLDNGTSFTSSVVGGKFSFNVPLSGVSSLSLSSGAGVVTFVGSHPDTIQPGDVVAGITLKLKLFPQG